MASYIKFNCDYQLVYLAQTIITLNGFDNILQNSLNTFIIFRILV